MYRNSCIGPKRQKWLMDMTKWSKNSIKLSAGSGILYKVYFKNFDCLRWTVIVYIFILHFEFEMEAAVFKFMLFPPDAILPVNLIGGEPHPWERAHWEVICPAEGMTLVIKWNAQIKIHSCSKSMLGLIFDYPPPPPTPLNHFRLLRYSNIIPTHLVAT